MYDSDPFLYYFFEPGYLLFNSLVKTVWDNTYFFFFIVSLLSYYLICNSLYKYPFYLFSFFLFFSKFFICGFVYVRQFIAMGIVWWAMQYLENNRRNFFLFFLLLAATIHYSALVVIPIYFISKRNFSLPFLSVLFLFSLILGITPFIKWAMDFVNELMMLDKLEGYAAAEQTAFHIPYFIETSLIALAILKFRDYLYANNKYNIVLNLLVLYVVFAFLTIRDAGVIRFSWYFYIGYVVILPVVLNKFIRNKKVLFVLIITYFSFVYFRNVIVRDEGNFIPYKVFFIDTYRVDKFS